MLGAYYIYTSWSWFITLLLSMLLPLKNTTNDNTPADINSANVTFSPRARELQANQQRQSTSETPLTRNQIHDNVVQAYADLVDVLNLNCLPVLGCVHTRTEWFMKRGILKLPPPVIEPCHTKCHVCNGKYSKTFLPVIYSGAMRFLKSTRLTSSRRRPVVTLLLSTTNQV